MRKAPIIQLSSAEHQTLCKLERAAATPQALVIRVSIILLTATGMANKDIAQGLGLTEHTVGHWRNRFVLDGIAGLADKLRHGRPPEYDEKAVANPCQDISFAPKRSHSLVYPRNGQGNRNKPFDYSS